MAVESTLDLLLTPLTQIGTSFVDVLPGVLAAIVILVVGYFIAQFLGWAVEKILDKLKVGKYLIQKTSLRKIIGNFQISRFFRVLTKWYVFILFFAPAAVQVKLPAVSAFLLQIAQWVPNLIKAIIVFLIGIVIADYVAHQVIGINAKGSKIVAWSSKTLIIIVAVLIALDQLGINVGFAQNSFLIILGGIMLALAIGFGLAIKDEARKAIQDFRKIL